MLDVLGHLVRYGYYDDIQDVDELLGPLTELLNGETDLPSERKSKMKECLIFLMLFNYIYMYIHKVSEEDFRRSTRKKDIPENKGVFNVKVK